MHSKGTIPLYYAVIIYNYVLYELILKSTPIDSSGIGWPRYIFLLSSSIPSDKNFWVNLSYTWTISIFVLFYFLMPLMKRLVTNLKQAVFCWGMLYLISLVCTNRIVYGMPIFFQHYFLLGIVLFYAIKENRVREVVIGCLAFVFGSLIMNSTLTNTACSMLFVILIVAMKDIKITNEKLQGVIDVLVIAIVCTVVGAVVAYHIIERPMEKAGHYLLHKISKLP